ncbi:MAG: hypothetical protein JXR87_08365 [Candidatus Marinimicrobia bacterium]|nr:hypothetical protein [Candidatus Neomarinimicrobiota bacterium]
MNRIVLIIIIVLLALAACVNTTPEGSSTDPVIESVTLNYSQTNKSLFISADVFDPQGLETIDSVVFYLYQRDSLDSSDEELFLKSYLFDLGPPLDIINQDGVFSYLLDSTALAGNDGYYRVSVQAYDEDGNSSSIEEREELVAPNSPPELFAIELPSTFEKGDTLIFKIRVTDPQGADDIGSVTYSVLRPDDQYITSTWFFLSDDGLASGNWGDEIANDGIYTVQQPSNKNSELQGDFIFYFVSEDIHGAVSDTLKKIITNPGVHLLTPNWADTLRPYQTYKITWESAYINRVTIQYTTNANSSSPSYETVTTEFSAKGFYDWTIPYENSANCNLKIFDADKPSRYDISDNNFTIKP